MACRTRGLRHIVLVALTHLLRVRLAVAACERGQNPLVGDVVLLFLAKHIRVLKGDLLVRTVEQRLLHLLVHAVPLRMLVVVMRAQQCRNRTHPVRVRIFGQGRKNTVRHAECRVGYNKLLIELLVTAEPRTDGTRAERAVEREHARCNLGERDTAVHAGKILAEHEQFSVHHLHVNHTAARTQCRLERIRQAALHPCTHDKTVDDNLDRVLLLLLKGDFLAEIAQFPVDADAHIAVAANLVEDLAVLTLLPAHELRHDKQFRPLGLRQDRIHHLIDALLRDGFAAARTVRASRARVKQAQIVIDLRHRAHRRARIVARRLLVNRDRGRQPLDIVHIGLVHLPKELPRICGQRLHIAPLPLGVDRVKGKRGFPRAREARHDNELVARNLHVDIL